MNRRPEAGREKGKIKKKNTRKKKNEKRVRIIDHNYNAETAFLALIPSWIRFSASFSTI